MKSNILFFLLVAGDLAVAIEQYPLPHSQYPVLPPTSNGKYVLPMFDPDPSQRAKEVGCNRDGFRYGPSLLGYLSYFPAGLFGEQMVNHDIHLIYQDLAEVLDRLPRECQKAADDVTKAGGLRTLASFELLYQRQWEQTNLGGLMQGALTNYSDDLFFSMERLTLNPFSIRRLHPSADDLPFEVEESIATNLTGMSLHALHTTGRLFLADHSYQARYPKVPGRFTAACSAYFYIHPETDEFLPLAIETNMGANLTYTPLDEWNDWMLAKIMFNVNDLFHGQIYHVANSHAVAEVVHLAALRTLSAVHPVRAFLDRVMYQAYAIRPVGEKVLFNPGGLFDQSFALNHEAVRQFTTESYRTSAGPFQANHLDSFLVRNGFRNCTYGPDLAHVPFAEDATAIVKGIGAFTTSFVETYYPDEKLLAEDHELQAWVIEANEQAGVLDFPPSPLSARDTLIDILTHVAYLTGVNHQILNGRTLVTASGVLPFHPASLHHPLPTSKGITSLMPYLPDLKASLDQISLELRFNRPTSAHRDTRKTLVYMFSGRSFLSGACESVVRAALAFEKQMRQISDGVRARTFDEHGLSQGMPFVWQALDPGTMPFYLNV